MKSSLRQAIVRQFGQPSGVVGRLVGLVMATRPSNRERNRRTIELLEIQPDDRVLEIGYGPGLAIQWAAERAVRGKVVGIDHSDLMHRQAARRNARAIEAGLVELHIASVDALPEFTSPFDKVFAVNVHLFWPDPVRILARLAAVMKLGGTIALTFQPRSRGATNEDTRRGAERIAESLRAAGFGDVQAEILPMKPVDAVCVLGRLVPDGARL
jgi:cyclopropane fatty-acyl-phospholipid synthase-like methyltransferase